ncbi:MAG: tyrosine-type recombinase/integrase, partial [Alkalispirochaeta sp.]
MKEIQRTAGGDITRVLAYRDNYSYQTRQWVRWMQQTGQRIDETGIREYFRWLNDDSGLAAGTIRNRRSAVKKRVRQLYADAPPETKMRIEQILTDIDADFSTAAPTVQPEPVSSDRILSPTEYREALLRCRTDRQRCFLMVLWESGMRVSEATGITLDRCELTPEVVRCRILGKGRKERTVRIRRELYDYCRDVFRGTVYLLETA